MTHIKVTMNEESLSSEYNFFFFFVDLRVTPLLVFVNFLYNNELK